MTDPEPGSEHPELDAPNIAVIAMLGFMIGLVLWLGGACLVLGAGDNPAEFTPGPRNVSTAPAASRPTATVVLDRTDCDAIRGTEYRSATERQWFLANCG